MNKHKPWTWSAPSDDWEKTPLPMRASDDDLAFRAEAISNWSAAHGVPRGLIMGVTPEYARLPWPEGTHLVALDRSRPMIDAVWPGPKDSAACADWTAMPLRDGSRDIVLCDGGLSILAYPEPLRMAAEDLKRIVAPSGIAIFRLYVPPPVPETVETIVEEALAGRIPTSIELSIRFWGALHDPADRSYKAGESLTAIERYGLDPRDLFARAGWNPDEVDNLENMRQGDIWLYFPTVEEVFAAFAPEFRLESVLVPSYRLGDRFPTVIFSRR